MSPQTNKHVKTILQAEAPSLESFLEKHLQAPPGRALAVGWGSPAALGPLARPELAQAPSFAQLETSEPWETILWKTSCDRAETREAIARVPTLLAEGGTLVVVARLRALYDEMPPQEEADYRDLVQQVSEAALAIVEDRNLTIAGETGCWRLIVAKPDPMEIRSYRSGDEVKIQRLFGPCFHVERSPEQWRWKYLENPWGQTVVSLAFAPDGELAAQYAGYPTPFWIGDRKQHRTFLSIQLGDTMTNPAFRGLGRRRSGLLGRTVRHYFAARRDGTYGYYYGFPTRQHQHFCEWFIGARHLEPAPLWVRDLEGSALPTPVRGFRIEKLESPPDACDRLFRRVAPDYGFLMHRTREYLDWRYFRCPGVDFVMLGVYRWLQLVGWAMFRRDGERLIWGDALFEPRHALGAARAILAAAVRTPGLAGARRIEGWFSNRPAWWHALLPELGFERRDEPNQLAFIYFPDGEPDCPETLQRLYYTLGDVDLF